MRDLYEQLLREGEPGIQRLIDDQTQEHVQLDFKRKTDPSNGHFSKEDKARLGRLMSAFANSAGGLAIWGVDAHDVDGVDCARHPAEPIKEIERFRSEAQTLAGQLLMPRHDGIHIGQIPAASVPGAGYLLVLVERSERRPHRCEAAGEKQYFKRSGDSTFAMEHYDIEDAFRRGGSPVLDIECASRPGPRATGLGVITSSVMFELSLANTGVVLAKYPYLRVRPLQGCQTVSIGNSAVFGLPRSRQVGTWLVLSGGADDILHPGHSLSVVAMLAEHRESQQSQFDDARSVRTVSTTGDVAFEVEAGCENGRTATYRKSITRSELFALMA